MKAIYRNRYRDEIIFDHKGKTVTMTGYSPYFRYSWPNVYDKAYKAFVDDYAKHGVELVDFEEFKEIVHQYEDKELGVKMRPYAELVYSDKDTIDMVDPSGGPYLSRGMNLKEFFGRDYEDLIIKSIKIGKNNIKFKIK